MGTKLSKKKKNAKKQEERQEKYKEFTNSDLAEAKANDAKADVGKPEQKQQAKKKESAGRESKTSPRKSFVLDAPNTDRLQAYKFESLLGTPGHFGEAWKCTRQLPDGKTQKCAVKRIAKSRFLTNRKRAEKYLKAFNNEIRLMKKMDHPNVIRFYEAFEDSTYLYLSMELCEGGELFLKLHDKRELSEKDTAKILAEVLKGLKHLHDQNIVHCDLKPENLVFLKKGKDSPIKIIDFGLSKPIPPHVYLHQFAGTPYFTAPEVIEGRYYTAADMWSMGIIMFLLLFGYPPFHASKRKEGSAATAEILSKVKRGFDKRVREGYGAHFPEDIQVSDSARDLISKLLTRNTRDRYTVDEMMAHPWFEEAKGMTTNIDPRVMKSMREFHRANKFHSMVLHALTSHTKKEEEIVAKAFDEIDENHDGMITLEELKHALKGLNSKEVQRIFHELDENLDGSLDIKELTMAYHQRRVLAKEERLWEAFMILDLKGDMRLSLQEIKKAILENPQTKNLCTEAEIEKVFKEADIDRDGIVDYDEFLYMMGSAKIPPRSGTFPHRLWSLKKSAQKLPSAESEQKLPSAESEQKLPTVAESAQIPLNEV
eukprot:CAMPEP_0114506822 /NCGR_PEP_ID=MMETSP0109-20121206/11651_1 /TAXON_ID=29199 /ORGANISM="Chlorarachnion reptans, Strain CCCM449" /LENGTH=597 /DNA_ID=CAMNT_0001685473 /DNA_START=113 /DNA_END=1906 /DNA_ORIENTATION=+